MHQNYCGYLCTMTGLFRGLLFEIYTADETLVLIALSSNEDKAEPSLLVFTKLMLNKTQAKIYNLYLSEWAFAICVPTSHVLVWQDYCL